MNRRTERLEVGSEGVRWPHTAGKGWSSFCNRFTAFCKGYVRGAQPAMLSLVNELPGNGGIPDVPEGTEGLIGLANDFTVLQDDWLAIPFAEAPIQYKGRRLIQRLNLANAEAMVKRFHSWRGKLTRMFGGLPFFVGHPDDEDYVKNHKDVDTKSYGWIKDMAVGGDALRIKVDWSEPGRKLLANAHYKWFSPNFLAKESGRKDGMPVADLLWLLSCGFTNKPNWPVYPLANEQKGDGDMGLFERLKAVLGMDSADEDAIVLAVTNQAKASTKIREAIDAKWQAEGADYTALPNEATVDARVDALLSICNETEGKLVNAMSAVESGSNALAAEQDAKVAATEAFRKERHERAILLVNEAVTDGRVLPADRDKWVADLEEAFDEKSVALANQRKRLPTKTRTDGMGERESNAQSTQAKILALVNEKQAKLGWSYSDAWLTAKKENPELFAEAKVRD